MLSSRCTRSTHKCSKISQQHHTRSPDRPDCRQALPAHDPRRDRTRTPTCTATRPLLSTPDSSRLQQLVHGSLKARSRTCEMQSAQGPKRLLCSNISAPTEGAASPAALQPRNNGAPQPELRLCKHRTNTAPAIRQHCWITGASERAKEHRSSLAAGAAAADGTQQQAKNGRSALRSRVLSHRCRKPLCCTALAVAWRQHSGHTGNQECSLSSNKSTGRLDGR